MVLSPCLFARPYWLNRLQETWRAVPIAWLAGVRHSGKTTIAQSLDADQMLYVIFPGLQLPVTSMLADDTAKVLAALTGHEPLNGKPPEASFKSQD